MPLGQRLGKPSRSYLAGLNNEAGDGAETGSVLSYRSGQSSFSQQQGRRLAGQQQQHDASGLQGSPGSSRGGRGRYNSMPARGSAASDIGMTFTSASPSRLSAITASKARNSSSASNAAANRRSVQFSDMAPAMFDDRQGKLEVMSDVGGYRSSFWGGSFKKRTPSITSSVMNDNASDAGSTFSQRRSVKRGSKSDRVVQPPSSLNLWQNDLGGPGLVKRSPTGGTVVSTSDPMTSIVRRKSTLGSPKKFLGTEQPSRRYSAAPGAISSSASASGAIPTQQQPDESRLVLPSTNLVRSNSAHSSHSSSPAGSEASFSMRTTLHSKHSQKQRAKSGLDNKTANQAQVPPVPAVPADAARPVGLQRSLSAGSTGSKRSATSKTSSSAKGTSADLLHSSTLNNNLVNGNAAHTSPTKRKQRTPEQIVEALARVGMLDRVMEAVQEAEEEGETTDKSDIGHRPDVFVTAPTPAKPASSEAVLLNSRRTEEPSADLAPIAVGAAQEPSEASKLAAAEQVIRSVDSKEFASPAPIQAPVMQSRDSVMSTASRPYTPGLDTFVTPPSTPPPGSPVQQRANELLSKQPSIHSLRQQSSREGLVIAPAAVVEPHSSAQSGEGLVMQPAAPVQTASEALQPSSGPQQTTDSLLAAGTLPMPSMESGPLRLESLSLASTHYASYTARALTGTILALFDYEHATVHVRLTHNGWATYEEVRAAFDSAPLESDDFRRRSFSWHLPPGFNGAEIQLALRLEDGATNQTFWDNNDGHNYVAKISAPNRPARNPSRNSSSSPSSPAQSGHATPIAAASPALAPQPASAVPPRVFLVRTQSDESQGPNVLYDPKRLSMASSDGQTHTMPVVQEEDLSLQREQPLHSGPTAAPPAQMPVSQVPFNTSLSSFHRPAMSMSATSASSSTRSTPTGSLNGDSRLTPATSTATTFQQQQQQQPQAIPKHVLQNRASSERMSAYPQASSRAQSTISRGSFDSTNQPFHYPSSRNSSLPATQASMQQPRGSGPMASAMDHHPNIANDLSGMYVNGQNGGLQPAPATLGRTASTRSDARSQGGMSSMTLPTARRETTQMTVPKTVPGSAIAAGVVVLPSTSSTMRALTLTSNAAATLNRSFFRNNQKKSLRQTPRTGDELTSNAVITFGNLTPVPLKIRSDECLVQVFAAALDFWDRKKVEILTERGQGYGFVPGRAFVGKVIETGSAVDVSKVKKGDFVYGLKDLAKSGALADYISVPREALTWAPNGTLSLEQIAAVALSGAAAFQAMDELCSTLPRGSKLVILNAHEGVGAIALQLGQSLRPQQDLWILAHYPPEFADGDMILKALGASETLCGEVQSAIQSLPHSAYDAMLDTVGGRRIYDAGKMILHNNGYFVTTVGDALSVPTARAQWKKSLRAIFKRSEKKESIGYWFPDPHQDARTALNKLREISEAGQLKPVVKRVYRFEDGSNAFKGPAEQAVVMILDQERLMEGINSSTTV